MTHAGTSIAERVRDLLLRPLFGPDIFISYSRRNRPYVEKLAARLHERHQRLTIVTDRLTSRPAAAMHPDLTALVRRSSMMVLVLTKDSLGSKFVNNEIVTFRASDRPLVPIDVGNAVEKYWTWTDEGLLHYVRSPGLQPESERALGDVEKNEPASPSEGVVQAILDAIDFRLQTNRIRGWAGGAAALLVGVAVASLLLIGGANAARNEALEKRDVAEEERKTASAQAAKARQEADTARDEAKTAKQQAADAKDAETAARTEAKRQIELAGKAKEAAAIAQNDAKVASELAARRQETARGLRMAADAVNVLRQSPYLVETSALLGIEAMDRLERVDQRSVVADIALRDALAILPEVDYELSLPRRSFDMALSRNGRFVVSSLQDTIVLCATSESDCTRMPFEEHDLGPPDLVAFSDDGAAVAASHGTKDRGCAHFYSTANAHASGTNLVLETRPMKLALSRDGGAVAFVTERGVGAHDRASAITRALPLADVTSVEWSPADDEHLAITARGATIVWNFRTDARTSLATTNAERATFMRDGSVVASIQTSPVRDGEAFDPLSVWERRTRKRTIVGDVRPPFTDVAFSRDGSRLAVSRRQEGVHVYELATGLHTLLPGEPGLFAFSADGTQIAVGESDRISRLWSLGSPPRELARSMDSTSYPLIAVRDDGRVITASKSEKMRVWRSREWADRRLRIAHRAPVVTVSQDPHDGSLAAVFRSPAPLFARIRADGSVERCGTSSGTTAAAFRSDGALLVARNGSVQWTRDWCSGTPVSADGTLPSESNDTAIAAAATNLAGSVVVVGRRNYAHVYRDGEPIRSIRGGTFGIRHLGVDPTGRYVAVAATPDQPGREIREQPHSIEIWDVDQGPLLKIARPFPVLAGVFDPSGHALAIAAGSTVHVYDRWQSPGELREIARLDLGGRVTALAFSADGRELIAAGDHGRILFSHWRPEDLIEIACAAVKHPWSKGEWGAYNADLPFQPACAR